VTANITYIGQAAPAVLRVVDRDREAVLWKHPGWVQAGGIRSLSPIVYVSRG
jgi:hypothetical protein